MTRFRHSALLRATARLMFALWLLPLVLAALPSPASAADQALYADVMQSRCLDMDGDGQADTGTASHLSDHCCLSSGPAAGIASGDVPLLKVIFTAEEQKRLPPRVFMHLAANAEVVFSPLSQRGPPA